MKDVIVMGGNYSLTLGVTRSLGEAGFKSDCWCQISGLKELQAAANM